MRRKDSWMHCLRPCSPLKESRVPYSSLKSSRRNATSNLLMLVTKKASNHNFKMRNWILNSLKKMRSAQITLNICYWTKMIVAYLHIFTWPMTPKEKETRSIESKHVHRYEMYHQRSLPYLPMLVKRYQIELTSSEALQVPKRIWHELKTYL